MELTTTTISTTTAPSNSVKIQETESDSQIQIPNPTPTPTPTPKPLCLSNGVLKRKKFSNPFHFQQHHHHPVVVIYRECLKNHAASIGGHALDGCGEFMASPGSNPVDPTSLKCAACGCHRNFHRRDPDEHHLVPPLPALEYHSHHRHLPPPPPAVATAEEADHSSPTTHSSPSPPPISSAYYPASAPHMLLALSAGFEKNPNPVPDPTRPENLSSGSRKRFRTKFTAEQKVRMLEFSERVGWKMQKRDEEVVGKFCDEIGVEKGVLKVWMHNNKNTFGKKADYHNHHLDNTTTTTTTTMVTHTTDNHHYNGNGFCIVSRSNNNENDNDNENENTGFDQQESSSNDNKSKEEYHSSSS